MATGVRPTSAEQELLNRFSTRRIALATDGLARETVASGKRGEPVTQVNLRAMLEAAQRLAAQPAAPVRVSPTHHVPVHAAV